MQLQEIRETVKKIAPKIYNDLKENPILEVKTPHFGLYEIPESKNTYKIKSNSERNELGSYLGTYKFLPEKENFTDELLEQTAQMGFADIERVCDRFQRQSRIVKGAHDDAERGKNGIPFL